jgi:hypothetical protein
MDGTGLTQSNPTHVLVFLVDWIGFWLCGLLKPCIVIFMSQATSIICWAHLMMLLESGPCTKLNVN